MNRIKILDCTLRDGGYINKWEFGEHVIKSIISKLNSAKIDIIECGFLTETIANQKYSLFSDVISVEKCLPSNNRYSMFAAMIAIGEKEIHPSKLQNCNHSGMCGIRLTFHKHEIKKALEWASIIMEKGYNVFMQPVGTISYSDKELLDLIEDMNQLKPYAFYIVDTLGSMSKNELLHIFYIIDANLNPQIHLGFHPHNNLQLAFSNAQELSRIHTPREIIIDASVYGMGRAAGNLPTELITQYINQNIEYKYDITTILDIYDKYISLIRKKYIWGYEVPYHIAASNRCHPNYAVYLMDKQSLRMKDIERIIVNIPKSQRITFDKRLIEQLYIEYQNNRINDDIVLSNLIALFKGKNLLLLAPGKTLHTECNRIVRYIEEIKPFVISVNFIDNKWKIDACFVNNRKRIETIEMDDRPNRDIKLIATSNLWSKRKNIAYVDYYSYINQDEMVFDNVGLMLLKLLEKCGISEVTLAGFDGFKTKNDENYYDSNLILCINENNVEEKTNRITKQLFEFSKKMRISFLTSSIYEHRLRLLKFPKGSVDKSYQLEDI